MMIGNKNQFVLLFTCSQIDFKVLEFFFCCGGFLLSKDPNLTNLGAKLLCITCETIKFFEELTKNCHALCITPYIKTCGNNYILSFLLLCF